MSWYFFRYAIRSSVPSTVRAGAAGKRVAGASVRTARNLDELVVVVLAVEERLLLEDLPRTRVSAHCLLSGGTASASLTMPANMAPKLHRSSE